jgi:2'-5' RNA ligase
MSEFTSAIVMALLEGEDTVLGDPDQPLHATIRYYGEAYELPSTTKALIRVAVQHFAGTNGPIVASVSGAGHLGSEHPPAAVEFIESEAFNRLRELLPEAQDEHPHFTPHVTYWYDEKNVPWRYGEPLTFDRIRVAFGDEYEDFPLVKDSKPGVTLTWSVS